MTSINISELKAHLSQYIKLVRTGERVLVLDRKEPVAQLVPVEDGDRTWRERLAEEGLVRLGTQQFDDLRLTRLRRRPRIQEALQAIRQDPSEVRRR